MNDDWFRVEKSHPEETREGVRLIKERLEKTAELLDQGYEPLQIYKMLGISRPTIYRYTQRVKRNSGRMQGCWTDGNTDLLVELWGKVPIKEIEAKIPGSTYNGIRSKARKLGLEPYSRKD